MNKYYLLSVFILILFLTGCGNNTSNDTNGQPTPAQDHGEETKNTQPRPTPWEENFNEIFLDDLEIEKTIMIMGIENLDNTILASQIVVGSEGGFDFPPMGNNFRSYTEDGLPVEASQSPEGAGEFQHPNFQNMSEEDRAQFREQMQTAGRRFGSGKRPVSIDTEQQMTMVSGELIDKDEMSLTIKLEEGGSKIVFFSDETKFLEPKEIK